MKLLLNVGKAHDGTGNQLWKHGYVSEVRSIAVLRLHLAVVQIDDIAHRLKRIKADTDRQMDPGLRKLCSEQSVYGRNRKVGILEKGKYGQIDADAAAQKEGPPASGSAKALHQPPVCVVERSGEEHQQNVQRLSPRIKN